MSEIYGQGKQRPNVFILLLTLNTSMPVGQHILHERQSESVSLDKKNESTMNTHLIARRRKASAMNGITISSECFINSELLKHLAL